MTTQLLIALAGVFLSVAILAWVIGWRIATRSPVEKRLSDLSRSESSGLVSDGPSLSGPSGRGPLSQVANALPKSGATGRRLRLDLALAGFHHPLAPGFFSVSEFVCPVLFAAAPIFLVGGPNRWLAAMIGGVFGYMVPSLLLKRRVSRRQTEIQNGLADALDLLVLCLEAGSSLDQALVKAGEELTVAYPALGDQLRILIAEMRAGKPRIEAFRGLATRTRVDDVRSLTAMLVQTDRFGTSVAQALRTQSVVCRTKRRQRAEERAQKVGVKLVFPLVFCLFPALYVILLGPAFIQFGKVFAGTQ